MYISPNHPDRAKLAARPEPQSPPAPTGRPLASIPRPGGRFGPATELRLVLDRYEGHPYISARVWTRGPDGEFYPSRKGVSIKLREAHQVAAALIEAARVAEASDDPDRRDDRRPGPSSRPGRAGDRRQAGLPLAGG